MCRIFESNDVLHQTGHAIDGCSRCQGHSDVSRQQSGVFGFKSDPVAVSRTKKITFGWQAFAAGLTAREVGAARSAAY
jgi:hypothetical protein